MQTYIPGFLRLLLPFAIACGGESTTPAQPDADGSTTDGALPDDAALPPSPTTLAANEARPNSLAVYLGDVYWTTDPSTGKGQVKKLVSGTTVPITLAAQEDLPRSIAVGPGFIEPTAFWVTGTLLGQVRQIATTGAPPLSSVAMNDVMYSLDLDGDSVFVGNRGLLGRKALTNTSGVTPLATGFGNGVISIDADANGVVFGTRTTSGSWIVGSVARTGGTVTPLYTGTTAIRDVQILGSTVYFANDSAVKRVARTGGVTTVLAMAATNHVPWSITAADGKLFVATNQGVINPSGATGQILEIDPVTGAQRILASAQAEPTSIAVDATYVYWTNRGLAATEGQVQRVAR